MKGEKEISSQVEQKAGETQKYDQLMISGTILEIYYKSELIDFIELEKMNSDVFEYEYEPEE